MLDNKNKASANADDTSAGAGNTTKDDNTTDVEQDISSDDDSLNSDERKELEELREKAEIKKKIELLDEEYERKGRRNLRSKNQGDESDSSELDGDKGNKDADRRIKQIIAEERNEQNKEDQQTATEDFLKKNKDYYTPSKRDELLAEVDSYKDSESANYRGYTNLLKKAHKFLGGESSKSRSNVKKLNENSASSSSDSSERSDFSDGIKLTKTQKDIVKKTPGMTEKRFVEQLKQDRTKQ